MEITIVTSDNRLKYLKDNSDNNYIIKSVTENINSKGFYNVVMDWDDLYSINNIAVIMFHQGISYALDLKYSSYGTTPERY